MSKVNPTLIHQQIKEMSDSLHRSANRLDVLVSVIRVYVGDLKREYEKARDVADNESVSLAYNEIVNDLCFLEDQLSR